MPSTVNQPTVTPAQINQWVNEAQSSSQATISQAKDYYSRQKGQNDSGKVIAEQTAAIAATKQRATQLQQYIQNNPDFINSLDQGTIEGWLKGSTYPTNIFNQALQQNNLLTQQNAQLKSFEGTINEQNFGAATDAEKAAGTGATLQDALTNNQGTLGQLNQFESKQTADTFNKLLSPEVSMALGAGGLQNSGANVELQSKALAGLQLAQQQSIMQAGLGMQSNQQNLTYNDLIGGIGQAQQNQANLQQSRNFYTTLEFQQSLMNQQAELARQLSSYGGGSNALMGGIQGAMSGAMSGFMVGGPWGALAGGVAGGALGAVAGNNQRNGNQAGAGAGVIGGLGSNFFANSGNSGGNTNPSQPYPGLGYNAGNYPVNPITPPPGGWGSSYP